MKLSTTLFIIAISGMTVLSGCTKKNTKSKNGTKPAVQKPVTDTNKDTPRPEAPRAPVTPTTQTGTATTTTTTTTTPTDDTSTATTSTTATTTPTGSTGTNTTSTTPAPVPKVTTPTTSQISTVPVKKDPVIVYEECTTPIVRKLMHDEKTKTIELITPKSLSAIKLDVSRRCEKPTDLAADKAEQSLNKTISEVAAEGFPQSKVYIDFFKTTEEKKLTEAERANIYQSYELSVIDAELNGQIGDDDGSNDDEDAAPVQQQVARPTATPATAAPTSTPTPQPVAKPAATPTPAPQAVVQTPKAPTTPVPAKTPEIAQKDKPAADPLANYKKCLLNIGANLDKSVKDTEKVNATPEQKQAVKAAFVNACPTPTGKDGKENWTAKYMSDAFADAKLRQVNKETRFYTDEAILVKIEEDAKSKLYAETQKSKAAAPATPAKDDPINVYKKCVANAVQDLSKSYKPELKKNLSPSLMSSQQDVISKFCQAPPEKDGQIAELTTQVFVESMRLEFKDSKAAIDFYAQTEAKKLPEAEKNKLYQNYKPAKEPPKTSNVAAKPSPKPLANPPAAQKDDAKADQSAKPAALLPIEVKDLAAFEICAADRAETLINYSKKGEASREVITKIEIPFQILPLKINVLALCKIAESKERNAVLLKVITQKVQAHYPNSKEPLDVYVAIEKKNLSLETKAVLLNFYNTTIEVQFKDLKILGKIDPSNEETQQLVYNITQVGGEMTVTNTNKVTGTHNYPPQPIAKSDKDKIRFHFDFDNKGAGDGTLSISGEMNPHILDLKFIKGDLLMLKAKQPVVVQLSNDSWKKAIENRIRLGLKLNSVEAQAIPLKFEFDFAKPNEERMCELTHEEMKCKDGEVKIRLKFDDALIKAIP